MKSLYTTRLEKAMDQRDEVMDEATDTSIKLRYENDTYSMTSGPTPLPEQKAYFHTPGDYQNKPLKTVYLHLYSSGRTSGTVADPISCLLYTSPSPRDRTRSRMPSSA